jgi:hypothetical protein
MVSRAPIVIAHPPLLRPDWETLIRLVSMWSKPLDLDACHMPSHHHINFVAQPTNWSLLDFEFWTKKPSQWFWCTNHQTVDAGFETQTKNHPPPWVWGSTNKTSPLILRPNRRNRRHRFWDQTRENCPSGFDVKSLINLRFWFWGSTKEPALLVSTCMVQTAHGDSRPLDRLTTEYATYTTISGPLH